MFDDFDIDYNQHKYLIETRLCGALVKMKSALVVKKVASTDVLVAPEAPSFDGVDEITIPTQTGVRYLKNGVVVTGTVVITATTTIYAEPTSGYYFATSEDDSWTFSPAD